MEQGINGNLGDGNFDLGSFGVSTASGLVLGPAASKLVPTKGRLPSLVKPRTPDDFGEPMGSDSIDQNQWGQTNGVRLD